MTLEALITKLIAAVDANTEQQGVANDQRQQLLAKASGVSAKVTKSTKAPADDIDDDDDDDEEPTKAPAARGKKKAASKKKVAAKRTTKKAEPVGMDAEELKAAALKIANSSGVEEPLKAVRAFIKSQGHKSLAEIDESEQAEFLELLAEELAAIAASEGTDEDEDEDDDYDL